MNFILSTITAAVMYVIIYILFNSLYRKKHSIKEPFFWVVFCISFLGAVLLNYAQISTPFLNFAYMFISFCVINLLLYHCKLVLLFRIALMAVIMSVCDMSSFFIMASVSNGSVDDVLANDNSLIIVFLLNLLLLFATMRVFLVFISKNKKLNVKFHQAVFYTSLTVAQMLLIQYIHGIISDKSNEQPIIIIIIAFLVFDIYIAFLLHRISKTSQLEAELKLANEQMSMQSSLYNELSDKYRAASIISHDIKKHISSLEGLIDNRNTNSASIYIKELHKELEKLTPQFYHKNSVLSVIVNYNMVRTNKLDIDFNINIDDDITLDFVSDMDLTTILANVLDNAVEACQELEKEQRSIRLTINCISDYILINVSNKYKSITRKPNGGFESTKTNHSGIGLKSAKSAICKYGGYFDTETKDNLFISKITLPQKTAE